MDDRKYGKRSGKLICNLRIEDAVFDLILLFQVLGQRWSGERHHINSARAKMFSKRSTGERVRASIHLLGMIVARTAREW
jgi:hypothetical protein